MNLRIRGIMRAPRSFLPLVAVLGLASLGLGAFMFAPPGVIGGDEVRGTQVAQSAAAGAATFIRCRACHTIGAGEAHRVGPNLYTVIGRTAGTVEGFANFSDPLKNSGIVWNAETLDTWLANPAEMVPGNRMQMSGLSEGDRADIIAYILSVSNM